MAALPQSNTLGWSHKVLAPIAVLTDWILITIEGWRERFRLRRELNDLRFDGELDRTLANRLVSPFDVPRLVKVHPGGRDGRRCARLMKGDNSEIDTLVPPTAGGLLGRMIVLARLRECNGHHEPQRVLLDRIFRQMLLLSRMSERVGVAATAAPVDARGVARGGAWLPRMHELAAVSAVARRKFAQ